MLGLVRLRLALLFLCASCLASCRQATTSGFGLTFYSERPRNLPGEGLLVRYVAPSTPAHTSGLRPGDSIVVAEKREVGDQFAFGRIVEESGPAACIAVRVKRAGQTLELPCIKRGVIEQSAEEIADAADDQAPYVEIDGAVDAPGIYALSSVDLRAAVDLAKPRTNKACLMVMGPRARRADRQCYAVDQLPRSPRAGHFVISLEE